MKARASLWASLAIAASIGLAGCGGSSDTKTVDDMTKTPTAEQLKAEQDGINREATDALTAISALASSDEGATDDLVEALETAITDLDAEIKGVQYGDNTDTTNAAAVLAQARGVLKDIEMAKTSTANKERADAGKALLDKFGIGTGTLNSGRDELTITTGNSGVTAPRAALEKTETTVDPLGSWKGVEFALRTPEDEDEDLTSMDHAVIYTNQGDGESDPLTASNLPDGLTALDPAIPGTYAVTANTAGDITGDSFPKAGTRTYSRVQKFAGTYKGISGTYECNAGCTASNDGDDITVGANWRFTPAANSVRSTPDNSYLYFGWWTRTDKDGEPEGASAFHGSAYSAGAVNALADPSGIGGTATYSGKAAGRFAIYDPQDRTGNSGDFTANVMLTAKFAAWGDDGGVSGTVNGFEADGKAVPWLVTLNRANWNGATGAFGDDDFNYDGDDNTPDGRPMTSWSLDGDKDNAADADGSWQGSLHDEARPTGADDDDGNNVPNSATGVFHSKFGETHEMVGAFGAGLNN